MSLRARAWAALLLPAIAWFVFEQGLSALLHADCARAGLGIAWGIATLAACVAAAWLAPPPPGRSEAVADQWLGRLTRAVAAIFALATAFQTLAIILVPACLR